MLTTAKHATLRTNPQSGLHNSQNEGIGRLGSLGEYLLINNLGKNVELSQLSTELLTPVGIFADTIYPDQDDEQQFDFDMHCFLECENDLIFINHYGLMRFFDKTECLKSKAEPNDQCFEFKPTKTAQWLGDVERFVIAQGRLVSTSPDGYATPDPAEPGLIISEPLARARLAPTTEKLTAYRFLQDWGTTTTIAIDRHQELLAVTAGARLGVFKLTINSQVNIDQAEPGMWLEPVHTYSLPFRTCFLEFTRDHHLIAAGYDLDCSEVDGYDWDKLGGGGWLRIDLNSSTTDSDDFAVDLAWGHGADPVVLSSDQTTLYGLDRFGGLHSWTIETGEHRELSEHTATQNLGLAHTLRFGQSIICGYNRDGFRIHQYNL